MWPRAASIAGLSVFGLVACGGDGGSPSPPAGRETMSAVNPTEPAAGDPSASSSEGEANQEPTKGRKEPAPLTASPACAPVGSRVVLKLGLTSDRESVDCYDVHRVRVVFTPDREAKVTVMGPMSDGFCAIDVEVPKEAESGKVRVEIGDDAFETSAAFPVPCP
jgi:hypothetical protein